MSTNETLSLNKKGTSKSNGFWMVKNSTDYYYMIFGEKEVVNLIINQTNDIINMDDAKSNMFFSPKEKGYTIIFDSRKSNTYENYYFEQVTGKAEFHVFDLNVNLSTPSILPIDDFYKVNYLYKINDKNHLIGVTYDVQCSFIIHKVKNIHNKEKEDLNKDSSTPILIKNNTKILINPTSNINENEIEMSFYLPDLKYKNSPHVSIKIEDKETIIISKSNNSYTVKLSTNIKQIEVSSNTDALIIVQNIQTNNYKPIINGEMKEKNIVYSFPKSNDYTSINLSVILNNSPFKYYIYRKPDNTTLYLPDLNSNQYYYYEVNKSIEALEIDNPYYKMIDYKDQYYYLLICFSNDQPMYNISIIQNKKGKYEFVKENTLNYIMKQENVSNTIYSFNQDFTQKSSIYVLINQCSRNSKREVNIQTYNKPGTKYSIDSYIQLIKFDNKYDEYQISVIDYDKLNNYEGIRFTYKILDSKNIIEKSYYDIYNSQNYNITYNSTNKIIQWTKVKNGISYKLFVISENEGNLLTLIDNICYLNNNADSKFKVYGPFTTTSFNASNITENSLINVIAQIDEPIKMQFMFKSIKLTINSPQKKNNKTLMIVLIIVISVIVLAGLILLIIKYIRRKEKEQEVTYKDITEKLNN